MLVDGRGVYAVLFPSCRDQSERARFRLAPRFSPPAQSQGHHTSGRLEERGVERGSARRSSLKGRERVIVNQNNIGTVSKTTLGKILKRGGPDMGFS